MQKEQELWIRVTDIKYNYHNVMDQVFKGLHSHWLGAKSSELTAEPW